MTDAERTPEQHSPSVTEQTEQAPSLLEKIVDRAKDTANAVVGKAQDVTETSAAAPAQDDAAGDAAAQPQGSGVVATVANTASNAADTVTAAAQTIASKASDATTVARRTLSRIYSNVTGEKGASYTPPAEAPKGGRPRRFKDVTPGMQLEGKVTSIALYGIFVDVGVGRDGLVHISEMSDKRIEAPTDLVQIGTPVTVWVKSVDADARRISLTMRDPNRPKPERTERRQPRKPEINREKLAALKPGDTVEGVISSLAPFGAFVDIGAGKDGLVHISELAEGRVEKPEDAVTIGERYPFRVLEVDPEGNRISLSLRRAQRANKMQQLEPGTQLEGTISGLAAFGAFVDIGVGRDGLVHVSELSSERVSKVEDVVKVGDKVQVKVLEVDPNSKRISLTMRVDEPPPAERPRPQGRPGGFNSEPAPAFGAPSSNYGGSGYSGERSSSGNFGGGYAPPRPDMMPDSGAARGARTRGSSRNDGRDRTDRFDDRPGAAPRRGNDRNDRGGDRPAGGRGGSGGGSRAGGGRGQSSEQTQEVYTFEDPEEESFTGDASLQDLLSKFNSGKGRDSRRNRDDDDLTDEQRRNDAIQRTLALRDEE